MTLERLRATGMPLKDVQRFAVLANSKTSKSKVAAQERLALLLRHQERLHERRKALDACETYLKFKINIYRKQVTA